MAEACRREKFFGQRWRALRAHLLHAGGGSERARRRHRPVSDRGKRSQKRPAGRAVRLPAQRTLLSRAAREERAERRKANAFACWLVAEAKAGSSEQAIADSRDPTQ